MQVISFFYIFSKKLITYCVIFHIQWINKKKREQKRPEGLRPEFPRVRAHESSGIRPRLGSQHLPIPPPLQTQPIPEPPQPKLDQKYLDWLDEQKRHNSKSFKKNVDTRKPNRYTK